MVILVCVQLLHTKPHRCCCLSCVCLSLISTELCKKKEMPDKEVLLNPRADPQVFAIFCGSFLSCLVGKIIYKEKVLLRLIAEFVTVSDEAYALVYLENSYDRWLAESNGEPKPPIKKWTSDHLSATLFQGWNQEGIARYNELYMSVKEKRKDRDTKKFELVFQGEVKDSQLQKGSKKKMPLDNEVVLEPLFDDSDVDEKDDSDDDDEDVTNETVANVTGV